MTAANAPLPHGLRRTLERYLTTEPFAHACEILADEPLLLHPRVLRAAAQILKNSGRAAGAVLSHRVSTLGNAMASGVEEALSHINMPGRADEFGDYSMASAERTLSALINAPNSHAAMAWLRTYPQFVCPPGLRLLGNLRLPDDEEWNAIVLRIRTYLLRRAFEVGPELALRETSLVHDLMHRDGTSPEQVDLILHEVELVGELFKPQATLNDQAEHLRKNAMLVDPGVIPVAVRLSGLDTSAVQETRTAAANGLEMLLFAIEVQDVDAGIRLGGVRALLTQPSDDQGAEAASQLLTLFALDGGAYPMLALDDTFQGSARVLAERRLRQYDDSVEKRLNTVRDGIRSLLQARSWLELRYLLGQMPSELLELDEQSADRFGLADDARVWNGYPLVRLLGDVKELGVVAGVARAVRRQTGAAFAADRGDATVIVVDRDWAAENGQDGEEYERLSGDFFTLLNASSIAQSILATEEPVSPKQFDEALQLLEQDLYWRRFRGETRAQVLILLARVLEERYDSRNDIADLELGILALQEALTHQISETTHAEAVINLAQLEVALTDSVETLIHLHAAIERSERLLHESGIDLDSDTRALGLYVLARAYDRIDSQLSTSDDHLPVRAEESLAEAMTLIRKNITLRNSVHLGRIAIWLARYEVTGDRSHLEKAEREAEEAVTDAPPGNAAERSRFAKNRIAALMATSDAERSTREIATLTAILEQERANDVAARTAVQLGRALARADDWPASSAAYARWVEIVNELASLQVAGTNRERILSAYPDVAAEGAAAYVRAGDPARAALVLEQTRTFSVRRRMDAAGPRASLMPGEHPDLQQALAQYERLIQAEARQAGDGGSGVAAFQRVRDDRDRAIDELRRIGLLPADDLWSFDGIAAAAAPIPLVYLTPGDQDGLGLWCWENATPRVFRLPGLSLAYMRQALDAIYAGHARQVNARTIDRVVAELWPMVIKPLLDVTEEQKQLSLVLNGGLSVLPLTAAWAPDDNRLLGRVFASDVLDLSFVSSAAVLRRARAVARPTASDGALLEVRNSGPAALRFQDVERTALQSVFPGARLTSGDDLDPRAAAALLESAEWVHLSCHAVADLGEPSAGALLLGDTRRLTLRQVQALDIARGGTVVLSACETAVEGARVPSEAVSFPSMLMALGASNVVGSLWKVPQASTAELMMRLYEGMRNGSTLRESLRLAQHACRDSTAAEKEAYFERSGLRYPGLHPPHSRPSARLTAWAGFCLYGDGWVRAGGE